MTAKILILAVSLPVFAATARANSNCNNAAGCSATQYSATTNQVNVQAISQYQAPTKIMDASRFANVIHGIPGNGGAPGGATGGADAGGAGGGAAGATPAPGGAIPASQAAAGSGGGAAGALKPGGGGSTPAAQAAPGMTFGAGVGTVQSLGGAGADGPGTLNAAASGEARSAGGPEISAGRAAAAAASAGYNGHAVGSNPNWAPSDVQKLQATGDGGFDSSASAERGGGGANVGEAAGRAPSIGAHDDFLGRKVADLSGGSLGAARTGSGSELSAAELNKIKMGDYRGALDDALKAIAADPSSAEAYLRAAQAYNHLNDYADAEKAARAALEKDPTSAEAWKNLAWAQLKQGKYAEALQSAMAAVKIKPDMAEAWAIASYAASHLGIKADAAKYMASAAKLEPAFEVKLRDAKEGKLLSEDLDDDDTPLFGGSHRRERPESQLPLAAGAAAGTLAVVGAAAWWFWKRRAAPVIKLSA